MKSARATDSLSLFPAAPAGPDYSFEERLLSGGSRLVAGVDEAGRGPLAGPVVAAAVILDRGFIPDGLDDSKKLCEASREALFEEILASGRVAWAAASAAEIDRINILQASLLAMTRAAGALHDRPCHILVDGRDVPLTWRGRGTALIKGDGRSVSISAASIVAKVVRDRIMKRAAEMYPHYGFERHKGYGSAQHRAAIAEHGPCPLHRMSFSPLRKP
jgi:ribonuclease HII